LDCAVYRRICEQVPRGIPGDLVSISNTDVIPIAYSNTFVTRADYWRMYNGQGEIGTLSAMTAQDIMKSAADPVLLELGIQSNGAPRRRVGQFFFTTGCKTTD
jgi:hypothetical protein